jgi:hypothetical protein
LEAPVTATRARLVAELVARGADRDAAERAADRANLPAAGPRRPAGARSTRPAASQPSGLSFGALCAAAGLPVPVAEFRFHPTRKWRFDFAWPDARVALEVEGSVPGVGGRHRSYDGWRADMAKYNAAATLGWRLVRCTPATRDSAETLEAVRAALTLTENA